MMLYQRIKIKVIALLMISGLVGLLGVGVAAAPVKKVPKELKSLPKMELPYGVCNKGCVDLKVTQSCNISSYGVHYEDVEVCTREDMHHSTQFKCNKYTDRCFPFTCDQEGKACLSTCYKDADCQEPNRCITNVKYGPGNCRVPTLTCNHDILSNGFDTVTCHPYRCMLDPLPRCYGYCRSTGDCSPGYVCSSDGKCVPN